MISDTLHQIRQVAQGAVDRARFEKLQQQNARMRSALEQVEDYLDGKADVIDGDYGFPAPNKEMQLLTEVQEALK